MARYADIDKLIADGWHLERHGEGGRLLQSMSLADVPTVDAVEVVRCGDCVSSRLLNRKDRFENAYDIDCVFCTYHDMGMKRDGFCSCGERR